MAITKHGDGGKLARISEPEPQRSERAAKKAPAKRASESAAKHHAAKGAALKKAVKKAAKKAQSQLRNAGGQKEQESEDAEAGCLAAGFHHLHRASAVISLLEAESGADLRALLEDGIQLYRAAVAGTGEKAGRAQCASGLLRAAEHLAMAGLYSARRDYCYSVKAPKLLKVQHALDTLDGRLDGVDRPADQKAHRLLEMARLLLRRALSSDDDPHLRYELVMAADGICSALEHGV